MSEQDEKGFIKGEIVFIIVENKENHFSILKLIIQETNGTYEDIEIVFMNVENKENHLFIVKLKIHETNEPYEDKEIVLKAHFTNLQKGVVYLFHGALTRHPRFGMQYDVSAYKTYVPATKDAVIAY